MARELLIVLLLTGCAGRAAAPITVTREVKVPVPVRVTPPPALMACGSEKPGFQFFAPSDPRYSIALRAEDAPKLRAWVDAKQACIEGWRALHR